MRGGSPQWSVHRLGTRRGAPRPPSDPGAAHPVHVSEFRTEPTGLTQCEVDAGVGFAKARRTPAAEHPTGRHPWAGWGDDDRHQFTRQCRATRTPYPFGRHHPNAESAFTEAYGLRSRPGMAQALEIAGLPLDGRHHRGEDDA